MHLTPQAKRNVGGNQQITCVDNEFQNSQIDTQDRNIRQSSPDLFSPCLSAAAVYPKGTCEKKLERCFLRSQRGKKLPNENLRSELENFLTMSPPCVCVSTVNNLLAKLCSNKA
ncbi:hypothetical protein CSKR_113561 [Clonorchis sinensis]|uniref:Uncharacterized protein n=1 Tax=Clonorchis sinensis TaxID=79923 RepID=A0A419PMX9_CLOSI|nr:hypothetical protein CSKR_113561 [Clonorchis sinensis]